MAIVYDIDRMMDYDSLVADPFGYGVPSIVLPSNIESLSPQEKAQLYNRFLDQGFTNTEIRNAVEQQLGTQSNANWGALLDIASGLRASRAPATGGALQTSFGEPESWTFGKGATYEQNMITAPEAYFQRGQDVVVSDELFWNPNSPTGDALRQRVQEAKAQGNRAGVVITPYAVFQNKASNQQLLNEIRNSGVDFVALDPYLGFGAPKEDLLKWTKDFIPQLNNLGLGVKLVTQDFARSGMEQETRQYNQELMSIPGVSEFVSFGLEDAPDLQGSPDWVSLSRPTQPTPSPAQETPMAAPVTSAAPEAPPPFWLPGTFTEWDADSQAYTINSLRGLGFSNDQIFNVANRQFGPQMAESVRASIYAPPPPPPPPPRAIPQAQAPVAPAITTQPSAAGLDVNNLVASLSPNEQINLSLAREANAAYPITRDGTVYNFLPDGSIETIQPTDTSLQGKSTGATLGLFSPEGQAIVDPYFNADFGKSSYSDVIANAALAGLTGGMLGPAGAGLLSAPAAAAVGSGLTALGGTGDIETALKAAAVGGLGALGAEQAINALNNMGYNAAFAAADAAQLANQGLDAAAIAQNLATYVDPTTAVTLANNAANQAFALADATQLAKQGIPVNQIEQVLTASGVSPTVASNMAGLAVDTVSVDPTAVPRISAEDLVPDIKFQPQAKNIVQGGLAPESVTVSGTLLPGLTTVPALPEALTSGLLSSLPVAQVPTAPPVAAPDRVEVTGQTQQQVTPETVSNIVSGLAGQLPVTAPSAPTQTVPVAAPTAPAPAAQQITPEVAGSILSSLTGSPVSVGGAQTVEVPGQAPTQSVTPETAAALISSVIGQTVTVAGTPVPPPSAAPETVGGVVGALAPTQSVPVPGTRVPPPAPTPEVAGGVVSSLLPTTTPPATQQVPVEGTRAPAPAPLPVVPPSVVGVLQPVPLPGQPPAPAPAPTQPEGGLFKPSDILTLLGLLSSLQGGGGDVGGAVTGTRPITPPSDTLIGSTTPQFGPDYYAAVQRYYNTFMPQYPRNVAGPLQQWYENTFGA